jgi:hypothetical protein
LGSPAIVETNGGAGDGRCRAIAVRVGLKIMPGPKKKPKEKDRHAEARARMAALPKLSERMIDFARPLHDLLPQPPAVEELRAMMVIATVAWNLPLYERDKMPQAEAHRALFDKTLERMPPIVAKVLADMLYSRLTQYGDDPRLGFAEVIDEGHGDAKVVATGGLMGEP